MKLGRLEKAFRKVFWGEGDLDFGCGSEQYDFYFRELLVALTDDESYRDKNLDASEGLVVEEP